MRAIARLIAKADTQRIIKVCNFGLKACVIGLPLYWGQAPISITGYL